MMTGKMPKDFPLSLWLPSFLRDAHTNTTFVFFTRKHHAGDEGAVLLRYYRWLVCLTYTASPRWGTLLRQTEPRAICNTGNKTSHLGRLLLYVQLKECGQQFSPVPTVKLRCAELILEELQGQFPSRITVPPYTLVLLFFFLFFPDRYLTCPLSHISCKKIDI